jgi:DnaJ family protein C protein 17
MPLDDLITHATSASHDFYALLDISPSATDSEIRRAYRRTALKYHPDKITNPTQADIDKFHLLQIANDVLSDLAVRQLYDNAREARERKKREVELLDGVKRKMREDLERREREGMRDAAAAGAAGVRGVKRGWGGEDEAEERLQREIERIAEDGRRRRLEREEKLKKEVEEDEKRIQEEEEEKQRMQDRSSQRVDRSEEGGANVPEQERAVKVRWVREGRGVDIDKDRLMTLFAPFGKIESVLVLKDRRQRLQGEKQKKTVATGVIVFASIVSAHTAVLDSEKFMHESLSRTQSDWNVIDSVFWALGEQPNLAGRHAGSPSPSSDGQAAPSPKEHTPAPAPAPKPTFNFAGLKSAGVSGQPGKAPSFGSFSSAAVTGGSKSTPAESTNGAKTSFQEITLMRLKNAQREKERRALEEQLEKEDAAADAAEAAART